MFVRRCNSYLFDIGIPSTQTEHPTHKVQNRTGALKQKLTDPLKNNASPLQYGMIEDKGDNYLSMSVVKNPEASNLIYTAEVSSDLIHWSPATEIVMDTTHSKFNDALPISQAPKMFIRLKAESHL